MLDAIVIIFGIVQIVIVFRIIKNFFTYIGIDNIGCYLANNVVVFSHVSEASGRTDQHLFTSFRKERVEIWL